MMMNRQYQLIDRLRSDRLLSAEEIVELLRCLDHEGRDYLFSQAAEVRQQIFSLRAEGDRLEMTLACGEPNLRADRLCENIAASYGGELTRLTRTDLLFGPPENLQSFSAFLHPESPG